LPALTNSLSSDSPLLVKKLEMWISELARIRRELEASACSLADLGVLPPSFPPAIAARDSRAVVRLKERLIALHRRRQALLDGLAAIGGQLLDVDSFEVLLADGPQVGSFLSWQPGEPRISHWRAAPSPSSPRMTLPGEDGDQGPLLH
jgi:hypothetical protein